MTGILEKVIFSPLTVYKNKSSHWNLPAQLEQVQNKYIYDDKYELSSQFRGLIKPTKVGIPRKMSSVFLHTIIFCIILLCDLQLCYLYQASVDTGVV